MENRREIELHSGEETPRLPEQFIMEEILPRLPAKSLLKFRCVSKPWCSLIGSKRFIKAHLKYSIKTSWFAPNWIFIDYVEEKFKQCSLPSMSDKPFTTSISHISDLGIDKSDLILPVGCCNGLVCILVNWKRFILWNPTTKKVNNLPDLRTIPFKWEYIWSYGFGFDMLTNDYKVFGSTQCTGYMVYSLCSNSWKHIQENNVSPFGRYVSGKLHWNNYKGEIVSFDLNSHVSGVVELPSHAKGNLLSLGAIGGCLSAHFFHQNRDLDVWVMKEYGLKESWDKLVTVPYNKNKLYDIPVAIVPDGECDVLRNPQIIGLDWQFGFIYSLGRYIESLASVAPDAQ